MYYECYKFVTRSPLVITTSIFFNRIQNMLRQSRFVWMCALLLFGAGASFAQFDTATVSGVVRDQANAVVTNSKVTLENVATGVVKTGSTDQNGSYTFFD